MRQVFDLKHKNNSMKNIFLFLFSVTLLSSCVTSKVHEDLQTKYDVATTENENLRKQAQQMEVDLKELEAKMKKASKDLKTMEGDTIELGYELRRMKKNYADLNRQYEYLLNNNSTMLADNARQNKALLERLEALQEELEIKEDSLSTETAKLGLYQDELYKKSKRLVQLEQVISEQDSIMNYVQTKLSSALMGFEGKGLTIEKRNGKVYVSLENSLLFASGSWEVSAKGKMALDNLSKVLGENPDIKVLVEGHTDTDAYRGSGQVKDNWDLSVMRATSVVKILTEDKNVIGANVTAAGKSFLVPIATNDTKEGKAANRRIEIILTPDLEGLYDVVE